MMSIGTALLFAIVVALASAAALGQPLEVPGLVQAEDPEIEHTGGLGNLPGLWAFWSNAELVVRCNVPEAGLHRAAVRAAGQTAVHPETGEKWPKMVVQIDGPDGPRFEWDVTAPRGDPEVYLTEAVQLKAGEHTISVAFANDYSSAGEDRNLFVDWVGVGPVDDPKDRPVLTMAEKLIRQDREAAQPDWTFAGGVEGWEVWQEAEVAGADGALAITVTGSRPLIVSPRVEVAAREMPWLSLVMEVDKGTRGSVGWLREGEYGITWHEFEVIADGQPHTYAMDLFGAPGWDGTISGLVVQPCEEAGARVRVRMVRLDERPHGPAELQVTYCGLDDPINRVGREARLVCSLANVGGEPARKVQVALQPPEGVAVREGDTKELEVVERRAEVTWTLLAEQPVEAPATVRVTGEGLAAISTESHLSFTPRARVAPAMIDGQPYVPAPQPVASDYLVGVYYFPGWKQGTHRGWPAIMPFPERKPVLGWYQEGDPAIADWHIKWAVEHGVSFFAYDWYWEQGRRHIEHGLHDGYLKSRYRQHLKFCLLYANHNRAGTHSEQDCLDVTRFWLDHYFHQPEYLKIDGKPVVIYFSVGRIVGDLGVEGTARAFERMRELCRNEGLEGLYIAGCTRGGQEAMEQLKAAGFDAGTGYNYPDAGIKPGDGRRPPYEAAIEGYRAIWERIAEPGLVDAIPVTDPGWDSRPWHGERALIRAGKDPDKFKRMLELARDFTDGHPIGEQKAKMVLVEAWNEHGEGAAIEPYREFGFGHLDAIREVFTDAPRDHEHVTPQDVGLTVPQWEMEEPQFAWEFDEEGEAGGWRAVMGLGGLEVAGGVMRARTTSGDPAFTYRVSWPGAEIPTWVYKHVAIRLRVDGGSGAQLFWATRTRGVSETSSVRIQIAPDGEFHTHVLDLSEVAAWRGEAIELRLDPTDASEAQVEIDYIRLLEKAPE